MKITKSNQMEMINNCGIVELDSAAIKEINGGDNLTRKTFAFFGDVIAYLVIAYEEGQTARPGIPYYGTF